MMYKVDVCRIGYAFRTLEIEADSKEEAMDTAFDTAGNFEFSEKDFEYDVKDVHEIV